MQRKKLLLKKNEETWLPLRWSRRSSEVKQKRLWGKADASWSVLCGASSLPLQPCRLAAVPTWHQIKCRKWLWQVCSPMQIHTDSFFSALSLQALLSQIMALFCLQDQCKQQISGRQDGCRRLWEPLSLCWVAARIQPLILCDLHLPGANSIPPHSYQAKAPEESCCGCRLCWCGFYSF